MMIIITDQYIALIAQGCDFRTSYSRDGMRIL